MNTNITAISTAITNNAVNANDKHNECTTLTTAQVLRLMQDTEHKSSVYRALVNNAYVALCKNDIVTCYNIIADIMHVMYDNDTITSTDIVSVFVNTTTKEKQLVRTVVPFSTFKRAIECGMTFDGVKLSNAQIKKIDKGFAKVPTCVKGTNGTTKAMAKYDCKESIEKAIDKETKALEHKLAKLEMLKAKLTEYSK